MLAELVQEMRALTAQRAQDAGKATVVDPAIAALMAEVRRNSAALQTGAGRSTGMSDAAKLSVQAAGLFLTILTIGSMIYAGTHTITQQQVPDPQITAILQELRAQRTAPAAGTAPQVIYVPAPPGAMLPTTPPQPAPR